MAVTGEHCEMKVMQETWIDQNHSTYLPSQSPSAMPIQSFDVVQPNRQPKRRYTYSPGVLSEPGGLSRLNTQYDTNWPNTDFPIPPFNHKRSGP